MHYDGAYLLTARSRKPSRLDRNNGGRNPGEPGRGPRARNRKAPLLGGSRSTHKTRQRQKQVPGLMINSARSGGRQKKPLSPRVKKAAAASNRSGTGRRRGGRKPRNAPTNGRRYKFNSVRAQAPPGGASSICFGEVTADYAEPEVSSSPPPREEAFCDSESQSSSACGGGPRAVRNLRRNNPAKSKVRRRRGQSSQETAKAPPAVKGRRNRSEGSRRQPQKRAPPRRTRSAGEATEEQYSVFNPYKQGCSVIEVDADDGGDNMTGMAGMHFDHSERDNHDRSEPDNRDRSQQDNCDRSQQDNRDRSERDNRDRSEHDDRGRLERDDRGDATGRHTARDRSQRDARDRSERDDRSERNSRDGGASHRSRRDGSSNSPQNRDQYPTITPRSNDDYGSVSSNTFAQGNKYNVMTGRSSTRRLAPPGGSSSLKFY